MTKPIRIQKKARVKRVKAYGWALIDDDGSFLSVPETKDKPYFMGVKAVRCEITYKI